MDANKIERVIELYKNGLNPYEIIYTLLVDDMRWSFSRVNSFYDGCRWCWYKTYIEKVRGEGGAFSEYGSFMHSIMEKFDKNELLPWEIVSYYEENYKDNVSEFPKLGKTDLNMIYYDQGLDYLNKYEPDPNWEVVAVEKEINTKIGQYEFIGYIDKLIRDKTDGKLIVLDYKSKNKFKSAEEQKKYARQLYLYSKDVYETYGEYPKMLMFDMFRAGIKVPIIFKQNGYEEAQEWFVNTIDDIYNCREFPVTEDKFFREELCNHRKLKEHYEGARILI